ncbi:MAG: response regulator [Desulfobulbaceae bacterium]|jgi:signal transduction histidine kinase/DNA-binding response OmpR family regulator|nr:response regulator [Desulfobulbaceae bacterium]
MPESANDAARYLRLLLRNTPRAMLCLDAEGRIVFCSATLARLCGVAEESSLCGQHFTDFYRDFVDESLVAGAGRAFQDIQRHRGVEAREMAITFPGNGEPRLYEANIIPLFDEDGMFVYAHVIYSEANQKIGYAADRHLRLIMDFMPMGCAFRESDGAIIDANLEAVRMFGLADKQEMLRHFANSYPENQPDGENSRAKSRRMFKIALENGSHTFRFMFRDRRDRLLPTEVTLVRVPWGETHTLISYFRDLRPEIEEQTRQEEISHRIRAMLDAMPLPCYFFDENNEPVDCNQRGVSILGCASRDEALRSFFDFNPEFQPDGQPSTEKAKALLIKAYAEKEVTFYWEHRLRDGSFVPIEVTLKRIPWWNGFRIISYMVDLRELRAKEQALRQANARMRLMLDALEVSCTLFNQQGEPIDCNARALAMFNCDNKQRYLENFDHLSKRIQADGSRSEVKAKELIRQAYQGEVMTFFWEHVTMDGKALPVEVTLKRVLWEDGYRVVSTLRDLREVRREQKRSQSMAIKNREARAALAAKNNFLASMSHEIRTPMNAVIGLADLMRDDNLDDKQRETLGDIRGMSRVLLQIINDILDLSKIESGKMELHETDYSIRVVYDNICSLTQVSIGRKKLEFHCHLAPDVPDVLLGDDVRMRQIMFNLLNNAIKYTPAGDIWFEIEREQENGEEFLSITVRDTGIGIKADDIDRLFEPFTRLADRRVHGIIGTGLGLPITRQLARLMGGDISARSRHGEGSEFRVRLPLVPGDCERLSIAAPIHLRVMANMDVKALVVDDSALNLQVALGYLARHGIQADSAASGREALKMVEATDYDLIFMDHMMPGMDGVEATKRIRALPGQRFAKVPIIALSANAISGMREIFIAAGMNDFLSKPIEPLALNQALLTWLPPEKRLLSNQLVKTRDQKIISGDELILDRQAGLANLQRDAALYEKVLTNFRREHANDCRVFSDFLHDNRLQDARRVAHTLKSAAATIGAGRLRRAADEVERLLSEGKPIQVGDDIPTLMGIELALLLEELAAEKKKNESDGQTAAEPQKSQASAFDRDKALALLDTLAPLLEAGSAACLDMIEEIEAVFAPLANRAEALSRHLNDLDFPAAAADIPLLRRATLEAS